MIDININNTFKDFGTLSGIKGSWHIVWHRVRNMYLLVMVKMDFILYYMRFLEINRRIWFKPTMILSVLISVPCSVVIYAVISLDQCKRRSFLFSYVYLTLTYLKLILILL